MNTRVLVHPLVRCVRTSSSMDALIRTLGNPAWRTTAPYTCTCPQLRQYSHQSDKQPQLHAKVIEIPNPLNALQNMWFMHKIHKNVDPDFNLEEFATGAKYAVSALCNILATGKFTQLKDMFYQATAKSINFLESYMASIPDKELAKQVDFQPDQLSILKPHITGVNNDSGEDVVRVSVHAIGTKPVSDKMALMMQLEVRLVQTYRGGVGSGWYLLEVGTINIREVTFKENAEK